MKKKPEEFITSVQLAKRWHLHPGTLKNWRTNKKGPPYIKVGSQVKATQILYKLKDVIKFEKEGQK